MVDDTHDLMSSSWPRACFPDGTMPGGHSNSLLLLLFCVFTLKFMLFVEEQFWHSLEIAHQLFVTEPLECIFALYSSASSQIFHQSSTPSLFSSSYKADDNGCTCAEIFSFFLIPQLGYTRESGIPEEWKGLIRPAERSYKEWLFTYLSTFVPRKEKEKPSYCLSNTDGEVDSEDHELIQADPDT